MFEVVAGEEIRLPVPASVPVAFPVKLIVPPFAPEFAMYVHVKLWELLAGIFVDAGVGPVNNVAEAVPVVFTVNTDGVTLLACTPPVFWTVMATVICCPELT
ncbi:MAG: hypothetical protein HXS46_17670 [Theionarchaea archaeon]|nr:hypothetical protein [Theionarchaea archaeon]